MKMVVAYIYVRYALEFFNGGSVNIYSGNRRNTKSIYTQQLKNKRKAVAYLYRFVGVPQRDNGMI